MADTNQRPVFRTQRVCFSSVMGNLHCEFFGSWMKTAFDYPSQLNGQELDVWREGQTVYGEIHCSRDVEGVA